MPRLTWNGAPRAAQAAPAPWRDQGCTIASRCRECPVPVCWSDVPLPLRQAVGLRWRRAVRREREAARRAHRRTETVQC